jgi:hypothetical protein
VSGFNRAVDIAIDFTPGQARELCEHLPAMMLQGTKIVFDRGWQLRIYSPFSGQRPIASCDL